MMSEAPPSYEAAKAGGSDRISTSAGQRPQRQQSNIPPDVRRSMEDSIRPLPNGWIRQWDPKAKHNFFVDTLAKPPRSTWSHPYDDEQYLRDHPEAAHQQHHADHHYDETTDEDGDVTNVQQSHTKPAPTGLKKLGQSMKNKMTGSTHAERVARRKKQREQEERAYQHHLAIRAAMTKAVQTGQPQLIGRDQQGTEIFAQPPPPNHPYAGASVGYGPYQTAPQYPYGSGMYSAPYGAYSRRPGYGYGGGMGLPLMGGLAGGMLLGGMMF